MWNIKTKVISVVTRATRTTSKQFGKYLNITPEGPISRNYTKQLGAAHLLQEVLMLSTETFNMGKSIT
jgi:hypothetical protein